MFFAALYYHDCVLVSKSQMNHNTFMFRLQFPRGTVAYVPVGKHVYLKAQIQGKRPGCLLSPHTAHHCSVNPHLHPMLFLCRHWGGAALHPSRWEPGTRTWRFPAILPTVGSLSHHQNLPWRCVELTPQQPGHWWVTVQRPQSNCCPKTLDFSSFAYSHLFFSGVNKQIIIVKYVSLKPLEI